MQIDHVINKMSGAGSQCERIDEHVVRCTKRYHDNEPYAVYYFDLHGDIPNNKDSLLGFQEKYLSEQFFGGPRYLRWNHYVVFVVDDKIWPAIANSELRHSIERDTTYARKIVLREGDFDDFAIRHREVFKEQKGLDDPTLQWRKLLKESGLEGVVFARHRAPTVSAWIEGTWKSKSADIQGDAEFKAADDDAKRIARITWNHFRAWPKLKDFSFAAVNLISGVNGSGKTSLLEAIECFYCGETRRNGAASSHDRDVKAQLEGQNAPAAVKVVVA